MRRSPESSAFNRAVTRAALLTLHSEDFGADETQLLLLDFIGNGDVLES
jgi:hypothetical protein